MHPVLSWFVILNNEFIHHCVRINISIEVCIHTPISSYHGHDDPEYAIQRHFTQWLGFSYIVHSQHRDPTLNSFAYLLLWTSVGDKHTLTIFVRPIPSLVRLLLAAAQYLFDGFGVQMVHHQFGWGRGRQMVVLRRVLNNHPLRHIIQGNFYFR